MEAAKEITIPEKIAIPKKIAMINDIAGYGRCSSTVSIPIISAMKVQVCPVPTSVFSNHTGFSTYHFVDLTEEIPSYFSAWEKLGLSFDGIYCGFLGSEKQIQMVSTFLSSDAARGSVRLIDPVMGDNGKAYKTITASHCDAMKKLITYADIITPNLTEACLLTDTPYHTGSFSDDKLHILAKKLQKMGPKKIVITGIFEKDHYKNYILDTIEDTYCVPVGGESRHGTGDMFASILAADAVNGVSFMDSVRKAADFIRTCTLASSALGIPEADGVCFENFLSLLNET